MTRPTDKLDDLYNQEKQQVLLESESVTLLTSGKSEFEKSYLLFEDYNMLNPEGRGLENFLKGFGSGSDLSDKLSNINIPLATTALTAALLYLSYRLYKKMRKKGYNELPSLVAQVTDLKRARAICKKTKDPAKCTIKIDEKIRKLQVEIDKIKSRG